MDVDVLMDVDVPCFWQMGTAWAYGVVTPVALWFFWREIKGARDE